MQGTHHHSADNGISTILEATTDVAFTTASTLSEGCGGPETESQ